MLIRFDDISVNTDEAGAHELTSYLQSLGHSIMWCISPLVHDCSHEGGEHTQRVYPRILNAHSDHRLGYQSAFCGVPHAPSGVTVASHGLWHIDHRLLPKPAQEASILTSCALTNSKTFVPPFNKWNRDTEAICSEWRVELVKFESGWKSMEHEPWDKAHGRWYLHPRFWTVDKMAEYMAVA